PPSPASHQDVATAAPRRGADAFEDHPTAAYSMQQAADPFGAAAAQSGLPYSDYADSPSEATRVAAIPQELLQAAARPATVETPVPLSPPAHPVAQPGGHAASAAPTPHMGTAVPMPAPSMPPRGNGMVSSEEQHFQDVFREFVATREQCGEANDGLTYEKFVAKLRKNKEQLVQKYACKTVRFQVYVKEGKAALKATPVKD
ncbi:MAG TPA: MXAN_5187 family protein, partial [Myxococcaceae bacterium]|nr:MXAN_5187 family protein [Myxococcaceae bacterium]